MAERTLFLNDWWLATLCTDSTDTEQNYFPLIDDSELALSLNEFALCLNGTTVTNPPVVFDGWEAVSIPTEEEQGWQWALYHDDVGYLVAAGYSGVGGTGTSGRLITSPDGLVWTIRATPTANFWWQPIYVPSAGLIIVPTDIGGGTNFLTSADGGASWTEHLTGLDNLTMKGIAWSEDLLQYVAWSWEDDIISSPDLITWTHSTISTPGGYWDQVESVVWSPFLALWCAIGFYGQVWTSTDGLSWTFLDLGGGAFDWDSGFQFMTWSEALSLFVAQGEHHANFSQTSMIITSPDAVNWTQRPLSDSGIVLVQHHTENINTFLPARQVLWDDFTSKLYVLTAADATFSGASLMTPSMYLLTSPDGIIWTIDKTVPGTHELSYPVFSAHSYTAMAIKDADNAILVTRNAIIRRIP